MSNSTFVFGRYEYEYTLLKQERKSLSLTVDPSLRIIVKAPHEADKKRIELFLKKKWLWLEKQLAYFEKYQRRASKREYLSGESYLYLGRQYQLVVRCGEKDKVALSKQTLAVTTTKLVSDQKHNKKLIDGWFSKRRESVFAKRFSEVFSHFDFPVEPKLEVRSMPKRWGSFVKDQKVVLNPLLIQAPKEAIDYVISHELCHMKYKNHDKKFYDLLESKVPNWKSVKEKLELKLN